ncbi:MAG: hypothetical protein IJY92_04485, partial [Alphaproteobacteria bacterium]|nr:hypothetical protein [Alphaproteobacteria bacterium]
MMNKNFKSILLGTTIFCICSVVAFSAGATELNTDGTKTLVQGIAQIQTNTKAGTTDSYTYTLPSSDTTQTIYANGLITNEASMTLVRNPNQLTINGDNDYNQVIQGTLTFSNPLKDGSATEQEYKGSGKLTINNVGSFTEKVNDYTKLTSDKIAGHIENLTKYLSANNVTSNGATIKASDAAAVHMVDADLAVNSSIFAFSDTSAASNLGEQGAAIHIRKELASTTPQAVIKDTLFAFNKSNDNGAAINADSANVSISNSTMFIQNTAANHGGAIDIAGQLTIDGTKTDSSGNKLANIFYNNSALTGGAVFVHDNSTATSTSNVYDSNKATAKNGGAVQNSGTFNSTGDIFKLNTSAQSGGAIANAAYTYQEISDGVTTTKQFPAGTINVNNSTFSSNKATEAGGAIYNEGTATVYGATTFDKNESSDAGGAIHNFGGTLNLTDTTKGFTNKSNVQFTNNKAMGGGAVSNTGTVKSAGVTYTSNTATTSGGAIYNLGSYTSTNGDTFTGNVAEYHGGAVYNTGTYTSTGTTYSGNTAGSAEANQGSGGAIFNAEGATYTSNGDKFINNTAHSYGGAIYNAGTFTLNNAYNSSFSGNKNNTTTNPSSAIYNAGTGIINI